MPASSINEPTILTTINDQSFHIQPTINQPDIPVNWISQLETIFDEFHEVKFTWVVNNDFISPTSKNNVHYMFYKDLDKLCQA